MDDYQLPCSPNRRNLPNEVAVGTGFCVKPATNKPPTRLTTAEAALALKIIAEMQQHAAKMKADYARQIERDELKEAEALEAEADTARAEALARRLRLMRARLDSYTRCYVASLQALQRGR